MEVSLNAVLMNLKHTVSGNAASFGQFYCIILMYILLDIFCHKFYISPKHNAIACEEMSAREALAQFDTLHWLLVSGSVVVIQGRTF